MAYAKNKQYHRLLSCLVNKICLFSESNISSCFCMSQFGSDLVKRIQDDMFSHETP